MTIGELLINDISVDVDFAIAGIQKGDIRMMIASMERGRALCQFAKKLVIQKYQVGSWGKATLRLNRIARDIETFRMGYDGWNVNDKIVQETLDEIEELERLLRLKEKGKLE